MTMPHAYFPICDLHGTNIVFAFPKRCPLAKLDPTAELTRMGKDLENEPAMMLYETCNRCVPKLLMRQHVRFLRDDLKKRLDKGRNKGHT